MTDLIYVFDDSFEHKIMITAKIYPVTNIIISLPNKKEKYKYYVRGIDYFIIGENKYNSIQIHEFPVEIIEVENVGRLKYINFSIGNQVLRSDLSTIKIYERRINKIDKQNHVTKLNNLTTYQVYKSTKYEIVERIEQGIKGTLNICNLPDDSGKYYAYYKDPDGNIITYTIVTDYTYLLKKLEAGEWVVYKQLDSQTVINGIETTAIQYVRNVNVITGFNPKTKQIKYQYYKQIIPIVNATIVFYTREDGCLAISGNILYTYYSQLLAVNNWDIYYAPNGSVKTGFIYSKVDLSKKGYTYWSYLEGLFHELKENYDLIAIPTRTSKYVSKNVINYRYTSDYRTRNIEFKDITPKYYEIDEPMSTITSQVIDVICVIPLTTPEDVDFEFDDVTRIWIDTYIRPDGLVKQGIFEHLNTDRFNINKIDEIHKDEDNSINVNLRDDEQHIFWLKQPTKVHTNKISLGYRINKTPKIVKLQDIGYIISEVKIHLNKAIFIYRVNPTPLPTSITPIDYKISQLLVQSSIISYEYLEIRNKLIGQIIAPTIMQIAEEHGLTVIPFKREKGEPIITCDDFYQFFKLAAKAYYEYFHFNLGVQNRPIDISVFAVYYNHTFCDDIRNIIKRGLTSINIKQGEYYNIFQLNPKSTYWWYTDETKDWKYNIAENYISTKPLVDELISIDDSDLLLTFKGYEELDIYKSFPYKDVIDQEINNSINLPYAKNLTTSGIKSISWQDTYDYEINKNLLQYISSPDYYYVYDFQKDLDLELNNPDSYFLNSYLFYTDLLDSSKYEQYNKLYVNIIFKYSVEYVPYPFNKVYTYFYSNIRCNLLYEEGIWGTTITISDVDFFINRFYLSGFKGYDKTLKKVGLIEWVKDPNTVHYELFGGIAIGPRNVVLYQYGYYKLSQEIQIHYFTRKDKKTANLYRTISDKFVKSGLYYKGSKPDTIAEKYDPNNIGYWDSPVTVKFGTGRRKYECYYGYPTCDCSSASTRINQEGPPSVTTIALDVPIPAEKSIDQLYVENLPKTIGDLANDDEIKGIFNDLIETELCSIKMNGYSNLDDFYNAFKDKRISTYNYNICKTNIIETLNEFKAYIHDIIVQWFSFNRGYVLFMEKINTRDIIDYINTIWKTSENYSKKLEDFNQISEFGTYTKIISNLKDNHKKIADSIKEHFNQTFNPSDNVFYSLNAFVIPNNLMLLTDMLTTKQKHPKIDSLSDYIEADDLTFGEASLKFKDYILNYMDIDTISDPLQKTHDLFFNRYIIDNENPVVIIKTIKMNIPVTTEVYTLNMKLDSINSVVEFPYKKCDDVAFIDNKGTKYYLDINDKNIPLVSENNDKIYPTNSSINEIKEYLINNSPNASIINDVRIIYFSIILSKELLNKLHDWYGLDLKYTGRYTYPSSTSIYYDPIIERFSNRSDYFTQYLSYASISKFGSNHYSMHYHLNYSYRTVDNKFDPTIDDPEYKKYLLEHLRYSDDIMFKDSCYLYSTNTIYVTPFISSLSYKTYIDITDKIVPDGFNLIVAQNFDYNKSFDKMYQFITNMNVAYSNYGFDSEYFKKLSNYRFETYPKYDPSLSEPQESIMVFESGFSVVNIEWLGSYPTRCVYVSSNEALSKISEELYLASEFFPVYYSTNIHNGKKCYEIPYDKIYSIHNSGFVRMEISSKNPYLDINKFIDGDYGTFAEEDNGLIKILYGSRDKYSREKYKNSGNYRYTFEGYLKFPLYELDYSTNPYDVIKVDSILLPTKKYNTFNTITQMNTGYYDKTININNVIIYNSLDEIREKHPNFIRKTVEVNFVRVFVFYSAKMANKSELFNYSVLKSPCYKTADNTNFDSYNIEDFLDIRYDNEGYPEYKIKNIGIPNEFFTYTYYDDAKWRFGNIHTIKTTMFRDLPLKFPLCRLLVEYAVAYYLGVYQFPYELNKFTTFLHDAHKFKVQFTEDKEDNIELIQFLKTAYKHVDLFKYYDFSSDFVTYLKTKFNTDDPYWILLYAIRLFQYYDENCDKIICGYIEQMGKDILIEYQDNYNTTLSNSSTHMLTDKVLSGKVININELNRMYKSQNYDVLFHKPQSLFAAYPIYGQIYMYSPGLNTVILSKYDYFDIEHSDWYILVERIFGDIGKLLIPIETEYPCSIWNLGWYRYRPSKHSTLVSFLDIPTKEIYLYELYSEFKQVRLHFLPWGYKIIELPIPVWLFKLPLKNENLIREIHARTTPARAVRHTRFSLPEYTKYSTAGEQFTFIENKLTRGILIRMGELNFNPNGKLYSKDEERIKKLAYEGWDFYVSTKYEYPVFNMLQDLVGPEVSIYPFFERFDLVNARKTSWDICREQLRQLYRYASFAVFEIDLTGNAYPTGLKGLYRYLKNFDSFIKNIFMNSIQIGILTNYEVDKEWIHNLMNTTSYSEIILQIQHKNEYEEVINKWSNDPLYKMKKISLSFKIYYGDNNIYTNWMNKAQFEYDYTRILIDDYSLVTNKDDYTPGDW